MQFANFKGNTVRENFSLHLRQQIRNIHSSLSVSKATKKTTLADISPRLGALKAAKRLSREKRTNQCLLKALLHFINKVERQALYLKLIREDQHNPWLEIVRANMLFMHFSKTNLAQAFHFYLLGSQSLKMRLKGRQRCKLQVEYDDEHDKIS